MTDEMKAKSAVAWCVLKLGETNASFVEFHESEGGAIKAASTLAEENDGVTFMVFQKFGSAKLQHAVEWRGVKG